MSNNRPHQQRKKATLQQQTASASNDTSHSSDGSAQPKKHPTKNEQPNKPNKKIQSKAANSPSATPNSKISPSATPSSPSSPPSPTATATASSQPSAAAIALCLRLVQRAVQRLEQWLGDQPLDQVGMLGFLQTIQGEYTRTSNNYLKKQPSSQGGNLMLNTFVQKLVEQFPELVTNLGVYYQQHYSNGVLQSRFQRLTSQNITPLLKAMSDQQIKNQPQKQQKTSDQGDKPNIQPTPEAVNKKKGRRARKRGMKKVQKGESESDKQVQKLMGQLQNVKIVQQERSQCHVSQQKLVQWSDMVAHMLQK